MTTPTDAQLAAIASTMEAFARRFKMADAMSMEHPLNEIDKQTLFYVNDHPDCGPTDVARFLSVPATTLTSVADRLVKKKLLERGRAETDRRAVALRLSDSGKVQVKALTDSYQDMYRALLAPLSPDDRDTLIRLLTNIVQTET
jgi:DNA-binding MarR family transcriptional regulator